MARMTENNNLQRALLRRLENIGEGTVVIRESAKAEEMRLGAGGQSIFLRSGDDWIRTSALVGADGHNSPVRTFSTIDTFGRAYPSHAVVATLFHESSRYGHHTAFQRFLPTGPLAFLPLSEDAATMVWSTTPELAAALKRLNPAALTEMINAGYSMPEAALEKLTERILASPPSESELQMLMLQLDLGNAGQSSLPPTIHSVHPPSVASFPLRLSHADTYLGDRTVLIGDAAHTVHPLAGQGLNMGLADARSLANVWGEARQLGADLGSHTTMLPYMRERYPANHLMLSMTDHLHDIFRARNPVVNWVRGTGLDVLNELGPIKTLLMGRAGAQVDPGKKDLGWPGMLADGIDGWQKAKGLMGFAGGILTAGAKNGLRRAADALERR